MAFTPSPTYADGTVLTAAQILDAQQDVAAYAEALMIGTSVQDPTFGALGDGVANDLAAIQAGVAGLPTIKALIFPAGAYRIATPNPTGGAAIVLSNLTDAAIVMMPGAYLLMDNLQGDGTGGGHGILLEGPLTRVWVFFPVIRWATKPSSRSNGDGIRMMGYPSDAAPPGAWLGSGGTCSRVRVIQPYVEKSAQTGGIMHGCTDSAITNPIAYDCWADGWHMNACRRSHIDSPTSIDCGDDGVALVTYYHATDVWQSATNGPFNQPALGEWSNYQCSATKATVKGGVANGARLAGSFGATIDGLSVDGKSSSALIVDAALIGGGADWAYQASRGCLVRGISGGNVDTGILCETNNIDSADSEDFWRFGVTIADADLRDCSNRCLRTEGDGSALSVIAGFTFRDIRGEGAPISFSSLRRSKVSGVENDGAEIQFLGQDTALSGAMTGLPYHDLEIDGVRVYGSKLMMQDLNGFSIKGRSIDAPGTAIEMNRCKNFDADLATIRAHRSNAGTSRGLLLTKVQDYRIRYRCEHDANAGGTWSAIELGGGDATDVSRGGIVEEVYTHAINETTSRTTVQGGSFGPTDYIIDRRWRSTGEAIPRWRRARAGSTTWPDTFIGSGVPSFIAGKGSQFQRDDGGAGTGLYVKESEVVPGVPDATGWVAK